MSFSHPFFFSTNSPILSQVCYLVRYLVRKPQRWNEEGAPWDIEAFGGVYYVYYLFSTL